MNKTEHLLTCLTEECSEVQKAAAKALRFGLDDCTPNGSTNNAEDIVAEIHDLLAIIEMLKDANIIPDTTPNNAEQLVHMKKEKVIKYMDYAIKQGTLQNK